MTSTWKKALTSWRRDTKYWWSQRPGFWFELSWQRTLCRSRGSSKTMKEIMENMDKFISTYPEQLAEDLNRPNVISDWLKGEKRNE